MKVWLIVITSLFGFSSFASGWAILLSQPELQLLGKQDPEVIKMMEAEMKKLSFDSGIIHVSAPEPARSLRFKSPGQDVSDLLPLLQKLGLSVTVSFSDKLQKECGFLMSQAEDGKGNVDVVINSKHPNFDLSKFRIAMAPGN